MNGRIEGNRMTGKLQKMLRDWTMVAANGYSKLNDEA